MSDTQPTPQFHHLIAAQLIFQTDVNGDPQQLMLNTTVKTTNEYVTAADLARAQQAVQMLLHHQLGKPAIVHNVIIISVNNLGMMTDDQFLSDLNRMREQAAAGQPN